MEEFGRTVTLAMNTHMGPEWVQEQRERQQRMNALYAASGREDPSHPYHSLFTGLYQEHLRKEKAKKSFPFIAR